MSSWIEMRTWSKQHELGDFPWDEWVQALAHCIPMPVYDLPRILDATAAYDMAVHAMYWNGGSELRPVRVPYELTRHLYGLGLTRHVQQVYMARALYAHCARYTTGVPRICDPPTGHMDRIPLMPLEQFRALAKAMFLEMPALRLDHWLDNTIRLGSTRALTLRSQHGFKRAHSGRRGRKHSHDQQSRVIEAETLQSTEAALASIMALAPDDVPCLTCSVRQVTSKHITIALYVQQRAPCGV